MTLLRNIELKVIMTVDCLWEFEAHFTVIPAMVAVFCRWSRMRKVFITRGELCVNYCFHKQTKSSFARVQFIPNSLLDLLSPFAPPLSEYQNHKFFGSALPPIFPWKQSCINTTSRVHYVVPVCKDKKNNFPPRPTSGNVAAPKNTLYFPACLQYLL